MSMLEPALIALRLAQYAGATILAGSSLFFAWRGGGERWASKLVAASAATLLAGALGGLVVQTGVMAGSASAGLEPAALAMVVSGTDLGRAAAVRGIIAAVALAALAAWPSGRSRWLMLGGLGVVAAGSLAWMGHAAATEGGMGRLHLASDILHAWAASVWLGALAAFLGLLLARPATQEARRLLYQALHAFSGVGTAAVAVLLLTGAVNSWILVGPGALPTLGDSGYGRLLLVKLALFAGMLALAAANRYRLTPALGASLEQPDAARRRLLQLRTSLAVETGLGVGILALVAWFGTLAPPSAG